MSRYVAVDLETTSLDPDRAWPVEIGLQVIDEHNRPVFEPMISIVPHLPRRALAQADPVALEINGYHHRLAKEQLGRAETRMWAQHLADHMLHGAHLVGANPAYDAAVLRRWLATLRLAPTWHFRLFDVEVATMVLHGLDSPPSLRRCCELWQVTNFDPHTALGDATAAADCYREIRKHSDLLNSA